MTSPSKQVKKTPQKRQNTNHAVILYPGIVKNADKAIETLGGHAKIELSHFSSRPLDLSHRPTNMYHRSVQSERKTGDEIAVGSMFVVVTIRRKKPKAPGDQPGPSHAEIVGPVTTYHSFKSMCDFQFLPLRKREDGEIEAIAGELIPTDIPSALTWWDRKGSTDTSKEPLFLPPFQFSRLTTPSPYMLCRETEARDAKLEGKINTPGQSLRLERKALSITVNGDEHFPDIPSEEAVNDANVRCRNDEPHRIINELFEERPVWTRQAISCKTKLEDQLIKILMPKYAFYIQSGPWGRLWCRFGYDPRKDPTARQYQTVMVSFRRHKKIPERPRLKMTDKWSMRASGSRHKVESTEADSGTAYMYTPGQLPSIRQMWYSLCDIGLQIAADYLGLLFEPAGNVADAQHGWLPSEALDAIRNEIKNDVKRTSSLIDAVEADEMGDEDDDVDDWLD